ncbi:stabilizer of axonemal microtubules 5 [Osmerus eperlanus]|uniref:stabilizer of axonemal microtubules 5 n=1 Tax=Osmerus eperlanus TaxID=29151 RepID=UPI002E155ED3
MATAVSSLIQAPLTGKDFHKSSHIPFKDYGNYGPHPTFKTTVQEDFHSFATLPKRCAIPRPPPAQVEHKDLAQIREYVTEAVASYPHYPRRALSRTLAWAKLCTNFKMHSDPKQVNYLTTQADGFKPQLSTTLMRITRPVMTMTKTQLKEKLPDTTHKATFPPHNVSAIVKAPVKHLGGEPTIKGDLSVHHFNTHHNEEFQGKWYNPPQPVEKPISSSVAMGDPKKTFMRETTHDESFKHPGVPSPVSITKRLQINLGDYSENTWTSTMSDAFQSAKSDLFCLMQGNKNQSSFPRGDTDVGRNRESMTATTNGFFFTEHNHRERIPHVSGANLRTKSNIELGRPSLGRLFYTTTTHDHYPRRGLNRVRPHTHPSGQVLARHEPGPALTTVQRDFLPQNGRRQELDPRQLQQIKESHIIAPYNQQHFSTTHKEEFGPKSRSKTCLDNHPRHSSL